MVKIRAANTIKNVPVSTIWIFDQMTNYQNSFNKHFVHNTGDDVVMNLIEPGPTNG
jgi:hypothetical protein